MPPPAARPSNQDEKRGSFKMRKGDQLRMVVCEAAASRPCVLGPMQTEGENQTDLTSVWRRRREGDVAGGRVEVAGPGPGHVCVRRRLGDAGEVSLMMRTFAVHQTRCINKATEEATHLFNYGHIT